MSLDSATECDICGNPSVLFSYPRCANCKLTVRPVQTEEKILQKKLRYIKSWLKNKYIVSRW